VARGEAGRWAYPIPIHKFVVYWPFTFAPGLNLRTTIKDGAPWFVAADVCNALGMRMTAGASLWLTALSPWEKSTASITYGGLRGGPARVIISESGLYTLIMRSTKPNAVAFRKWVTGVVLPSILSRLSDAARLAPTSPGRCIALRSP
jgi:prophage antirepressor-like protein